MGTSDKRISKRRDFLKKAAYTAPAILSLQAVSAVAKAGSSKEADEAKDKNEKKKTKDKEIEIKKKKNKKA